MHKRDFVVDGTYNLDGVYLRFAAPRVTLCSASGDREAVINAPT